MASIPHFALPFRMVGGRAVEVEQDSAEDVAACVEAVLRTRPGQRDALPEFGSPDLAFRQLPVDPDDLVAAVETWESRAQLLAEERPDLLDEAALRVRLTLTTEE
jgi:phage baseplate assembly protein W